jgi:hypothetical protein
VGPEVGVVVLGGRRVDVVAWPYIPPHKSAEEGALTRALAGELVEEQASLAECGGAAAPAKIEVSARAFSYRTADGALCPQELPPGAVLVRLPRVRRESEKQGPRWNRGSAEIARPI